MDCLVLSQSTRCTRGRFGHETDLESMMFSRLSLILSLLFGLIAGLGFTPHTEAASSRLTIEEVMSWTQAEIGRDHFFQLDNSTVFFYAPGDNTNNIRFDLAHDVSVDYVYAYFNQFYARNRSSSDYIVANTAIFTRSSKMPLTLAPTMKQAKTWCKRGPVCEGTWTPRYIRTTGGVQPIIDPPAPAFLVFQNTGDICPTFHVAAGWKMVATLSSGKTGRFKTAARVCTAVFWKDDGSYRVDKVDHVF